MTHVTGAYFSPTGGTKRALEAVCSLFEGEAELLELTGPNKKEKQFTPEDLLVLALPVYAGQHPAVPGLLDGLKGDNTPCVILATYGNRHYDDAPSSPPTSSPPPWAWAVPTRRTWRP